jgi:putative NADH-flavin reductase
VRILIIGAAGRTGRFLAQQAIDRGHVVTALARRPERLRTLEAPHRPVAGDATDTEILRSAVHDQDAVICAVGSSAILRALIPAMTEAGVVRLVMTSSRSVVATKPKLVLDLVWWRFRDAYVDLARAEGMFEASPLDWSIVRATMLRDGPYTGVVHTDFEDNATGGDWKLNRADYAMKLLDIAEDPAMARKAVGVAGAKKWS